MKLETLLTKGIARIMKATKVMKMTEFRKKVPKLNTWIKSRRELRTIENDSKF